MKADAYAYMLFVDLNDDGRIERIVSSQENYTIDMMIFDCLWMSHHIAL